MMRKPILIVVETNGLLADLTLRLVQAQGLVARLTDKLREACDLLSRRSDIVLLAAPSAPAAVRTALFGRKAEHPHILVVAGPNQSKEWVLELMEAGASSFMGSPATPKAIAKEVHRIRRLLTAA